MGGGPLNPGGARSRPPRITRVLCVQFCLEFRSAWVLCTPLSLALLCHNPLDSWGLGHTQWGGPTPG